MVKNPDFNRLLAEGLAQLKPTNRDKLRAMSDEELVKVINRPCPRRFCDCGNLSLANCEQCWLQWLQSPAGEEANVQP